MRDNPNYGTESVTSNVDWSTSELGDEEQQEDHAMNRLFNYMTKSRRIVYLSLLWTIWMTLGMIYYHTYGKTVSWAYAFYLAVDVGYAIGWAADIEFDDGALLFSCLYLITGCVLLLAALAYLIEKLLDRSTKTYEDIMQLKLILEDAVGDQTLSQRLHLNLRLYSDAVWHVALFLVWFLFGVFFTRLVYNWSWMEAVWFSLSTLSAGGFYPIEEGASDWHYLLIGIFACTGIPIMALAVGNLAKTFIDALSHAKVRQSLQRNIKAREYEALRRECLNDKTNEVDEHKLMIFLLVRQRAVDLDVVFAMTELIRNQQCAESTLSASALKRGGSQRREQLHMQQQQQQQLPSSPTSSVSSRLSSWRLEGGEEMKIEEAERLVLDGIGELGVRRYSYNSDFDLGEEFSEFNERENLLGSAVFTNMHV